MERSFLGTGGIALVSAIFLLFLGCSNPESHYRVIRGNYAFYQGEFQEANVQYLGMRKKGAYPEIVSFNLGSVYYVLGETIAAEEEWLKASSSTDTELLFRLYFNRGNLYYERSEYELSYHYYRKALEINPESRDAKNNLELCLSRLNASELEQQRVEVEDSGEGIPDDVDRVLQYIRRKEEGEWISGEDSSEASLQDW